MVANQKSSHSENDDQFQIQASIAQFATCTLYLVRLPDNREQFLLKLLPAKNENAVLTNEFLQRVTAVSQLDSPFIAGILASGLSQDQHAYAQINKPSEDTLASKMAQFAQKPIVEQLQFAYKIATAMEVAHQANLIHHHLSPNNIFLNENDEPYFVDLAVPVVPTTNVKSKTPITQLDYRPPEQREGKELTPKANIYSLGVILYTLLTGEAPYLPESDWEIFDYREIPREIPLEQVRTDLSPETYTLVQTCIWQREWDRYETMDQVLQAIELAIAAEKRPKSSRGVPPIAVNGPSKLPKNVLYVLMGILLLLLCLGGIGVSRYLFAGGSETDTIITSTKTIELVATKTSTPTTTSEPTQTPTNESTATNTATVESTNTATATKTPTVTSTSTPSPIPTETETVTPTSTIACIITPPNNWVRYTIQANDTISGLAALGNTTVARLQEVNCLEGNLLSLGRTIWVPASVLPTNTPIPPTSPPGNNPPPPPSGGGNPPPAPTEPPKATVPPPP